MVRARPKQTARRSKPFLNPDGRLTDPFKERTPDSLGCHVSFQSSSVQTGRLQMKGGILCRIPGQKTDTSDQSFDNNELCPNEFKTLLDPFKFNLIRQVLDFVLKCVYNWNYACFVKRSLKPKYTKLTVVLFKFNQIYMWWHPWLEWLPSIQSRSVWVENLLHLFTQHELDSFLTTRLNQSHFVLPISIWRQQYVLEVNVHRLWAWNGHVSKNLLPGMVVKICVYLQVSRRIAAYL